MGNKQNIEINFNQLIKINKFELGTSEKIILVMGETGVGKSSFINSFSGKNKCKVGEDVTACTQDPQIVGTFKDGYNIYLIDTPGLNDGKGDFLNQKKIKELKNCPRINTILISLRFNDTKLTNSIIKSLIFFMELFPAKDFWDHVLIIRTWSFSKINEGKLLKGICGDKLLSDFMKSRKIEQPKYLKEFFVDSYGNTNDKNKVFKEILNEIKQMHPIFGEVFVRTEEECEEITKNNQKYIHIKTMTFTTYVDFNGQKDTKYDEYNEEYSVENENPVIRVEREKTNITRNQFLCFCKQYKYNYIVIKTYIINGQKHNTKYNKVSKWESEEDDEIEGEQYRENLEKEEYHLLEKYISN